MDYLGPVGGTPLLPLQTLTRYFIIFLAALSLAYSYLYLTKKPLLLVDKAKLLLVTAVGLKIIFIGGAGLFATYLLVPAPKVVGGSPAKDETSFATNKKMAHSGNQTKFSYIVIYQSRKQISCFLDSIIPVCPDLFKS